MVLTLKKEPLTKCNRGRNTNYHHVESKQRQLKPAYLH